MIVSMFDFIKEAYNVGHCHAAAAGLWPRQKQCEEAQRLLPGGHPCRDWRGAQSLPDQADQLQGDLTSMFTRKMVQLK